MTQPTEYEQVTYNAPDGAQVGKSSSELIGFHGATPTGQIAFVATIATTALEGSVSASAIVGFSAGKFSLLVGMVNSIQAGLISKGLMASS